MTTITVASIDLKEKRSVVHTTEGNRLGCWTNNIRKFGIVQGGTFEVETETNDYGTLITKAKQIGSMPTASTLPTNGGGQGAYRPTCPQDAERMFVCATLTALIKAGEVKNDKTQLWNATKMLRDLWKHSFGSDDRIFPASETGRHAA